MKRGGTELRSKKLISIIVPVLNEQDNIQVFYDTVNGVLANVSNSYEWEFVFTDNHSKDRTFEVLKQLASEHAHVRAFRFSRNMGFQRSILTGYSKARGAAAIQIDCDLQDPPDLILDFLRLWEAGYRVVYGVRCSRPEAWWLQSLRRSFYRFLNFLSEDEIALDAGDFRLVDRLILDELKKTTDVQPYLRGIIASMGFTQIGVNYSRAKRQRGQSSFKMLDLVNLAIDGIASHSVLPLRLATYVGTLIAVVSVVCMFGVLITKILLPDGSWPAGFAFLATLLLMSIALNSIFLGIVGEYLGRVFIQLKQRPTTIIEESIDACLVNEFDVLNSTSSTQAVNT